MTDLARAALSILAQGFPVFPVKRQSRKPLIKWQAYQNELPSDEQARGWWTKWPEANIGMPTGHLSRLLVIDCDSQEAGEQFLRDYPEALNTLQSQTGRGRHFYFKREAGIRNPDTLGKGIDVRGEGEFVILPPSVHGNGTTYTWLNDCDPLPLSQSLKHILSGPTARVVESEKSILPC